MSVSDSLADMLTKIRNASSAGFAKVDIHLSNMKFEVIKILKSEGYIKNYKLFKETNIPSVRIFLKYNADEKPVIHGIDRISTPGRRIYMGYQNLPRIYNGFGTLIISTSQGITTDTKARKLKIGGELLCSVW